MARAANDRCHHRGFSSGFSTVGMQKKITSEWNIVCVGKGDASLKANYQDFISKTGLKSPFYELENISLELAKKAANFYFSSLGFQDGFLIGHCTFGRGLKQDLNGLICYPLLTKY